MKTEKTFAVLFIIALILRVAHIPGGSQILVLTLSSLTLCYLLFSFYFFSDKEIKRQNVPLSIVSGLLLCQMVIGILFKLMWWQGAQGELTIGICTAPILVLISYLKRKSPGDLNVYYKNMFTRSVTLAVLVFLFYFIPTETIIRIQTWNDPELTKLEIESYKDPTTQEHVRQRQEYYQKRDSINRLK